MSLRHRTTYNQYRSNVQTSAPATTVISSTEVENWVKSPAGVETANIDLMIKAATTHIERKLGCCLITQSFQMTLDHWPMHSEPWWDGVRDGHIGELHASGKAAEINIPRWPLQSIDSMTVDGDSVTVTDYFIVDSSSNYGRLVLKQGKTFPTLSTLTANGIVIDYTSGYGNTGASVPDDIKAALLHMASFMFEHRGDGCSAESAYRESGAKSLIDAYKIGRL